MRPKADVRLCHPVNIYVFKNGVGGELPTLVHIPTEKKRCMETVLEAIQGRVQLPAGYPSILYDICGCRVYQTYELEMYENYVVASNMDKSFRYTDYGKARDPLVVIGRESKNVRTLRHQNKDFDKQYQRRKQGNDKKLKYGFASDYKSDGYGPEDLPYVSTISKACGILCQKAKCNLDDCETGSSISCSCRSCQDSEEDNFDSCCKYRTNNCTDRTRQDSEEHYYDSYSKRQTDPLCRRNHISRTSQNCDKFYDYETELGFTEPSCTGCPTSETSDTENDEFLVNYIRKSINTKSSKTFQSQCQSQASSLPKSTFTQMIDRSTDAMPLASEKRKSSIDSDHLIEFVNRYRDIGGEMNRLFNERMSRTYGGMKSKTKLNGQASRESRLGGDLVRMFSERLETVNDDPENAGIDSRVWTVGSRTVTPTLPSVGDFGQMDDRNTGNESARTLSGKSGPVNFERAAIASENERIMQSLSALINDNQSQITGTTAPANPTKLTSKSPKPISNTLMPTTLSQPTTNSTSKTLQPTKPTTITKKVMHMTVHDQNVPFAMQDGKFILQNKIINITDQLDHLWKSTSKSLTNAALNGPASDEPQKKTKLKNQTLSKPSITMIQALETYRNSSHMSQVHANSDSLWNPLTTVQNRSNIMPSISVTEHIIQSFANNPSLRQDLSKESNGSLVPSPANNFAETINRFQHVTPVLDIDGNVLYYMVFPESR